ncbi:ribonuclease III [Clostridium sp. MSJ-11]|uniref:Ribonuclease 3 n=1 Tax=Clostridium mobile TaxID=2841512 RepID=A0ABS6EC28_9CLOT|nr:ribonuclease III [Clostridium mobile]MBU5482751.1 ribonuclease III [Clostridium mobile]
MDKRRQVKEIEYKLGVIFKDENLLFTAITHSSYANQKKNIEFNERLEFLGDSVLQLVITEYLYLNYLDKSEGELSRKRALIVCENSLFDIAQKWQLGKYINMSKGEELTGGRERVSILADCVEAIIAAIYLDRGIDFAKPFILSNFRAIIDRAMSDEIVLDYKTKLQEKLQENGEININYNLVKYEGPPHRRKFYTEVMIEDKILGAGTGYSKKESEQNAAKEAVKNMEGKNE